MGDAKIMDTFWGVPETRTKMCCDPFCGPPMEGVYSFACSVDDFRLLVKVCARAAHGGLRVSWSRA